MRKVKLLLSAMLLLIVNIAFAQSRVITGSVIDESNRGVAKASIMVKGTNNGTVSNEDGNFTLTVNDKGEIILSISAIGMRPVDYPVKGGNNLKIMLQTQLSSLDEVVVITYGGKVKRENFVGTAAQISAKDIQNRPLTNPLNALVGAAPGIQTTMASGAPGSSPGVIMRGFGSFSLSSGPLYVVDGAVYDAGFSNINPEDIETITALKDASATALYGSRASNGVIMITTKKGRKGRQTLQFKIQTGVTTQAIGPYNTVNAFQYYPLAWEAYRNGLQFGSGFPQDSSGLIASGLLPRYTSGANAGRQIFRNGAYRDIYQTLGNYDPFNVGNPAIVNPDGTINSTASLLYADDLNWLDQSTRTGGRNEYSISYTSGSAMSDLSVSVGYLKEKGWGLRSDMQRFTGRINANVQATRWFKTGFNLAANKTKFNNSATGGIVNPFYFSRYIAPIYPVHLHDPLTGAYALDALGQKQFDLGNEAGYARPYNSGRHSIAEHLWNRDNSVRDVVSVRAYGEISFTTWLKLTTNITTDITNTNEESYENPRVGDGYPAGRYSLSTSRFGSYTFNQILNFNKKIGLHNIDAIAGHENYEYRSTGTDGMRIGQAFDDIYVYSNFGTINSLTSSISENRMEAYLSRVNYDYDDKYLFSASFRRDGNSKFPQAIRWANFWSVGAGWRIDRESFFQVPWVNLLKLRASYGETGNAGTGNYPYQGGYSIGYDDDTRPGVALTSLGSPDLTWESGQTLDLGLDFSFLKNRITGTLGYFIRNTSGLIFSVPQPLQLGGTVGGGYSITQNIGNMGNKGIEIQLTGNIVRNANWDWSMTFNGTSFQNKIKKMPDLVPSITSSPFKREKGRSYYDFYTRTFYGIDPVDGQVLYLGAKTINSTVRYKNKANGDVDTVTIDHNNAVESYIGKTSIPKLFGSVLNNVRYKNLELSFVLTYQLGGYVYDGVYATLMSPGTNGTTYHKDIMKRWKNPGDVTDVPRMDNLRTAQYGATSTRFIVSGNYLSINNVSLAYRLPNSILSAIKASNIRVFVSAENLAMFSKRKGMNVNGGFSGTTSDSYDAARIINIGASFNF